MVEDKAEFQVTHPLGKGEVVSSILPGSTRRADIIRAFLDSDQTDLTFQDGTSHEHDISTSGESVESVLHEFAVWRRSFSLSQEAQHAAERVSLSLNACVLNPGRRSFELLLAADIADLEAKL